MTDELRSERSRQWLSHQSSGTLAISDWVVAELSAALSIKVRTGQLTDAQRTRMVQVFSHVGLKSFRMLSVNSAQFAAAARLADRSALGLRAGDALHLAIASESGTGLATLDRRLSEAAAKLGFGVVAP